MVVPHWPAGGGGRQLYMIHFLLILLLVALLNYLDENGRSHLTGQCIVSLVFLFLKHTRSRVTKISKVNEVYFRFPLSRQVIQGSFHPPHWPLRDVLSSTHPRRTTDLYTGLLFRTFESLEICVIYVRVEGTSL